MVSKLVCVTESGLIDGYRVYRGCLGVLPCLLPYEGATADVSAKVQLEIKVRWMPIRLIRARDQVLDGVCIARVFKIWRHKHSSTTPAISPFQVLPQMLMLTAAIVDTCFDCVCVLGAQRHEAAERLDPDLGLLAVFLRHAKLRLVPLFMVDLVEAWRLHAV